MRVDLRRTIKQVFVIAGAGVTLAASPAAADSSGKETSRTEMVAVIEPAGKLASAQTEPVKASGATDARFRTLFASWTALDDVAADPIDKLGRTSPEELLRQPVIAVPSRHPTNAGYVSSNFGWRHHPVLGRRKHHGGIDIAAPEGTPVYATADGFVGRADYSRSYGNVIYLDHGSDLETRYAHLSDLNVRAGQRVKKGDLIGFVGSTGRSTGPHLHYEVRVDGVAVNPNPYMKGERADIMLAEYDAHDEPSAGIEGRSRPGAKAAR